MSDNDDLVFAEMCAKIFSIRCRLASCAPESWWARQPGRFFSGFDPRLAGPTGYIAGPAMQKQQHGDSTILAANRDPLFDAADRNVTRLVDAVFRADGKRFRVAGTKLREESVEFAILGIKRG